MNGNFTVRISAWKWSWVHFFGKYETGKWMWNEFSFFGACEMKVDFKRWWPLFLFFSFCSSSKARSCVPWEEEEVGLKVKMKMGPLLLSSYILYVPVAANLVSLVPHIFLPSRIHTIRIVRVYTVEVLCLLPHGSGHILYVYVHSVPRACDMTTVKCVTWSKLGHFFASFYATSLLHSSWATGCANSTPL